MIENPNLDASQRHSGSVQRRRFLELCGLGAASTFYPQIAAASKCGTFDKEIAVDVVIIGGGLGGCAAALAATRMGNQFFMSHRCTPVSTRVPR